MIEELREKIPDEIVGNILKFTRHPLAELIDKCFNSWYYDFCYCCENIINMHKDMGFIVIIVPNYNFRLGLPYFLIFTLKKMTTQTFVIWKAHTFSTRRIVNFKHFSKSKFSLLV